MKKLHITVLFLFLFLFTGLSFQAGAQDKNLITGVIGKWKVIKYQSSKSGTSATTDFLVFEADGTFRSDSVYFGSKKGLFRTDENRDVLIIETGVTTEWTTSLRKGVLRLRSTPGSKQPKIYITAVRVKEDA